MTRTFRFSLLLLGLLAAGCVTGPQPISGPVRGIWVTRFDYSTADDVRRIMENCEQGGFNTVLFQVRGNGTAFYESDLEPWADELGGRHPGFDPLALACEEAHMRGLQLHAWVNVMPSWRDSNPPDNPDQLYLARPEWHWYDQEGRRQPLANGFYTSLNPCLPEVRSYLVDVFAEIVARYDIDGLHLDYIRFVDDLVEKGRDYPMDARTLALFHAATGCQPDQDPELWKRWRAGQVTALVAAIREKVRDLRPGLILSAAVGSEPTGPTGQHLRDSSGWARAGLLDALYPMNYTPDPELFARRTEAWSLEPTNSRIITGIMVRPDDRTLEATLAEVRASLGRTPHYTLFAYSYLFGPDGRALRDPLLSALRSLQPAPIP
ncbi:MAG: family 10 glycosylhydrolase [Planctomycetota bacterium]